MPIRVLDAATIGRIAAGEVVERPSSVAKELIENALDAKSTSITVEMRDGGISYLRVTDNGGGIAANEVRMAFENHATSKITNGDELNDIRTLGFRGEALPSIAAVSKVEVTTRRRREENGVKLIIEGGRFISLDEAGCPEGTTIIVRDLFFNLPVRRAFLKKPTYEAGVLSEMVARLMLGNPDVAIRLINGGKTQYHSFGDGSVRHAALAVYGRNVVSEMIEIDEREGALRLWGLIGFGDASKANRSAQSFFINGRLVRCALMTQALEEACKGRVMIGMHPMCALNMQLAPNAVDVNVHPNKLEIRFRDEMTTRVSVDALLARALKTDVMLNLEAVVKPPQVEADRPVIRYEPIAEPERAALSSEAELPKQAMPIEHAMAKEKPVSDSDEGDQLRYVVVRAPSLPDEQLNERTGFDEPLKEQIVLQEERIEEAPVEEAPTYRLIGVLSNAYLLIEIAESLMIVDQHAAHERILYERFVKMLEKKEAAQQLLLPLVVGVLPKEMATLMDNRDLLREIGYEIEPFGERDVQVRSVPHVLGSADLRPVFVELVDQMDQVRNATIEKRRLEIIRFSCKRAVKAGDALTTSEIEALIEDMRRTGAPPTCPHGRPVLRVMRKNEIERMFKRI